MRQKSKSIAWFVNGLVVASMVGGALAAIINPLPYIFQNGTTADATQVNADLAQIVNNVNANAIPLSNASLVPSGSVMAFNLGSCPAGWIASDGTSGTADLRGYFVRGLDTGGSIDPARTLATLQQDQVQDHTHNYTSGLGVTATTVGGSTAESNPGTNATSVPITGNHGTETRPKNVALLYCQKQ